jgi:ABC-type branched-subunit amino acid transport system substrate-binding protein
MSEETPPPESPPSESKQGAQAPTRRGFMRTGAALAAGLVVGAAAGGGVGYLLAAPQKTSSGIKAGTGTFTIGTSVSTSGSTAAACSQEVQMFQALVTLVNSRGGIYAESMGGFIPIQMMVLQDGGPSDLSTIKSNYTTLATSDKVDLLIGPFTAAPSETASPVAIQNQIPYIDNQADEVPIFNQQGANNWVVGSLNLINYWLWNYLNVVVEQTDAKTIALIDQGDDFSTEVNGTGPSKFGGAQFAQQLLGTSSVLATDSVNTAFSPTFDYTSEIAKMQSLDPDIIVYSEPAGTFQALFWEACKNAGYKPRAYHPIFGALGAFQGTTGTSLGSGVTADILWNGTFPYQGIWGANFWQSVQTAGSFTDAAWPWLSIGYSCVETACMAVQVAGTTDKPSVMQALQTMEFSNLLGPWKAQNPLTYPFAPPSGLNTGTGMSLAINVPVQIINGQRTILGGAKGSTYAALATGTYQYPQPTSF